MKVVVDGDSVAYKAAFSTQYQTYHIEEEGLAFRYHKDCNDWLALNFDQEERPEYIKVQVVEPINHTFHIVNKIIEGIVTDTQAKELIIYLSGEKNFRTNVPYPVVYKGDRPDKPIHLPEVRNFLVSQYNAIITDGYEADDAIGIYAKANPGCIIASIDKDLRMIPGIHYHLNNKTFTEVTELEGLKTFYKQMLTGDRVDNIIGIPGIGIKTAEKLIDKLYQESDMDRVVRQEYKKAFGKDWYNMYRSNLALLRILQSEEEYKEVHENGQREAERQELAEVVSGSDSKAVVPVS